MTCWRKGYGSANGNADKRKPDVALRPGYFGNIDCLNDEEGVETVLTILEQARSEEASVYLPFMTLMELEYLNLRKHSQEETQRCQTW